MQATINKPLKTKNALGLWLYVEILNAITYNETRENVMSALHTMELSWVKQYPIFYFDEYQNQLFVYEVGNNEGPLITVQF